MLQFSRSGSISHLSERPPSHTYSFTQDGSHVPVLLEGAEIRGGLPFALCASFLVWSRDCHEQSQLPLPLLCGERGAVSCPPTRWLLVCGAVRWAEPLHHRAIAILSGDVAPPQSGIHLVRGHSFTLPAQPTAQGL